MDVKIDVSKVRPQLKALVAAAGKDVCGVLAGHAEDIQFPSLCFITSPAEATS